MMEEMELQLDGSFLLLYFYLDLFDYILSIFPFSFIDACLFSNERKQERNCI